MWHRTWIFGLLLSGVVGCDRAVREVVEHAAVEPLAAPTLRPVSDPAAEAFLRDFRGAVAGGDADAISASFDWTALTRRSMAGLGVRASAVESYAEAMERGGRSTGVVYNLMGVKRGESRLSYLGPETVDGQRWHTFRMLMAEGGFEHLRLLLSADAQGRARVVDFRPLTQGELASATIRRVLLPVLGSDSDAVLGRLVGKDQAYVQHISELQAALKLGQSGRWAESLAALEALPPELKSERWVLHHRVQVAGMVDDAAYQAAIAELGTRYPEHPSTAVHLIDGHLMAGRYDEALAAVGVVEARSVPDPYLDVIRASILMVAERYAEAGAALDRAVAAEPSLEEAHWGRVSLALSTADLPQVTEGLWHLHRTFGVQLQLEGVPDYAEYVASPEYPRFLAGLGG